MGEGIRNHDDQQKKLKEIVQTLNEGTDIKRVKKNFDKLLRNVSPEEIANIEQTLINEGVPVEHVQKLCDIHVQVFDEALKNQSRSKVLPGHPVHSYRMENREAKKRLRALKPALRSVLKGRSTRFPEQLADLRLIELHYVRKENQLFPYLETVGFTGPSKVMWGKHDEIRSIFREIESSLKKGDATLLKDQTAGLIKAIRNMIFMEERILFPTALRKLPENAWAQIRRGEAVIGYAWIKPANLWDANIAASADRQAAPSLPAAYSGSRTNNPDVGGGEAAASDSIQLDTGALSANQLNLMLKNLPFDMTFVDENDKVAYYSEGKERIFPRSPGIIGRKVANCHPPKSVKTVERIVEALKSGEKTEAEFWLQMQGKFIHIRYFPLFDEQNSYRGIIEVSQEVSGIRALEGERRLLNW